jgi:hypothetical protein
MSLDFAQKFLRVVVKNGLQELGERAAFRDVWTEKRCGAFAPRELRGRGVANEPPLRA